VNTGQEICTTRRKSFGLATASAIAVIAPV
jgi:hypothetical protein